MQAKDIPCVIISTPNSMKDYITFVGGVRPVNHIILSVGPYIKPPDLHPFEKFLFSGGGEGKALTVDEVYFPVQSIHRTESRRLANPLERHLIHQEPENQ